MNKREHRRWINGIAARVIAAGGSRGHSYICALLTDAQRDNTRVLHSVVDAITAKLGHGPFVMRLPIPSPQTEATK